MDPVYVILDSDDSASDEDFNHSYFSDDGDDNADEEVNFDVDAAADYDPTDSEPVSTKAEQNCTILTEKDIKRRQEKSIAEICSVLEVSNAAACLLLLHHKWNVNIVHEEWFADEEKVREAVGILDKKVTIVDKQLVACGICFDEYLSENLRCSGYCDHLYCDVCWNGYVSTAISDGPGCLTLRCPDPKCAAAVGLDMVDDDKLGLSEDDKAKYHHYLLRSYVENSPKIKWCPAPGCEFAVEYVLGSGNYDVVCGCSNAFCWNCVEEAHRPVDCDTVAKWVLKNCSEAENTTWILAYSKPCPKCKRPIEKNNGCMHMTCGAPCKFEFCWLCLLDWKIHGYGNMNSCNGYKEAKAKQGAGAELSEAEKQRKMAKRCLERYAHYYERWASNNKSRVKALDDLRRMQDEHLETLGELHRQPVTQLKFIIEAWQQIAECRRVLKWTYAYGYYLFEKELAKKQFFEYLQGEAEAGLERLHLCAEKELKSYIYPNPEEPTPPEFNYFRSKLTGLTRVTRDYFENLVKALENGLSDVDPQSTSKKHKSSKNKAGTSKGMASGLSSWACDNCTYWNEQPTTNACGMCHRSPSKKAKRRRYDESDDEDSNYSDDDDLSYDDITIKSLLDKNYYTVLEETDIQQRQEEDIYEISSILQIPNESACLLLRHYNWKVDEVKDQWFANEEKVRKEVGIIHKKLNHNVGVEGVICGICFESSDSFLCVGCGHMYCKGCWIGYHQTAINDGPGCLMLRCPEPSCCAAVGQDLVDRLGLAEEDKERYNRYFRRTYVESRPTIKWCPAPGCEYAVKYDVGSASYDVVCGCRNAFCWNCTEDAHRPVDCETVSAWVAKNSSEAENKNWILANSKPCPKCKRPIEKNTGCMHMTCTLCRFEFCWLCLGDWKAHGESTGGFYACNVCSKAKASGELDEAEMKRQMASNSLERYTHYYERWESNNLSRQKALKELNDMHNVHLLTLSKSQNQPEAQVQFGVEAWQQIVECRRVLKWSYAYGYYLPAHESTKKNIFEYMQGQADAALDRLHHCAEIEKKYIYPEAPEFEGEYFNAFRSKLANLTIVTRNFFENLVKALENGLCDVDPEKTSSQQETPMIYKAYDESLDYWQCLHCTYVNRAIQTECEMCFIGVPPYNT